MIELRTLGETGLRVYGNVPTAVVNHPLRFGLFTYLVVADVTVHQRDTLVAMFWPELPMDRARGALRKALHYIRREVGENVLVNRGDDAIMVDRTGIRCDATAVRFASSRNEDEVVLQLGTGEFLTGFHVDDAPDFDAWVSAERKRLHIITSKAARRLSSEMVRQGRLDDAVDAVHHAQTRAPFNQQIMIEAVDVLQRAGHRISAIRVYDELARRLDEELNDHEAAIRAWEESLKLREELDAELVLQRRIINERLSRLRMQPA
jgi:DNA-binding SARP family transcriptional activator